MAGKLPCFLFKQTRVNFDWTDNRSPVSIDIHLPKHNTHPAKSIDFGSAQTRSITLDSEEKFKFSQHANAGSIYYRPSGRFPRCILWRVLEDWKALSITSVDFTRPDTQPEVTRTLRFLFPESIQPGSVGFADALDHDELVVYVLTTRGVLYTLILTPDMLTGTSRTVRLSEFCTTYAPSAFTLNTPHFVHPVNDRSLVVAMRDGSMLKLERQHPRTSLGPYTEKIFSESNYFGYLRAKLPWVGASTVPYRDGTVYSTTAVSALTHMPNSSPDAMEDERSPVQPLLFTACVDHTLKVWSLDQENLLFSVDLLNEPPTTSSKVRAWLDPSPSPLLAVIDRSFHPNHKFYLVSFSSASTGKFKFWGARYNPDGTFQGLQDLFPEKTFEAAPPSGTAPWIISEFRVTPASGPEETLFDLWVLWKSDTNFRIQNIQFDVNDIPSHWKHWATATTDSLYDLPRQSANSQTSEDVTDYWMKWIFYPGRFPDPVLESALLIYENNFVSTERLSSSKDPIQVRVGSVVASAVDLEALDRGLPDYEKYRNVLDMQWERYARLCTELDKARGEALSLVTDPLTGFVWTVNVDGITSLRECSETELIRYNIQGYKKNLDILSQRTPKKLGVQLQGDQLADVMILVNTSNMLLTSLADSARDKCVLRLSEEVVKEEIYSVEDQMAGVYEYCLNEEVPEETFIAIEEAFELIQDPDVAFQSIIDSLFHAGTNSGSSRLTSFGAKALVTGSQEMIQCNHQLLFGLIFLLIHVEFSEEAPYHRLSDPLNLYHRLLKCFREYEIMNWMARNAVPLASRTEDDEISQALTKLQVSEEAHLRHDRLGSALQLVLPLTLGPSSGPGRRSSISFSLFIRQFLAGLDLGDRGNGITNVVAALLRVNAAGAAASFSKFIPSSSWGTYMKARVNLKNKNFPAAATYFHKAAYGMAGGNRNQIADVGIFSNAFELEIATRGLAQYHLHVSKLFDSADSRTHVLEFTKTALTSTGLDDTLRLEILLQQFRSALKQSLFDDAYLALVRIPNKALQNSAIRDLATAMVEQNEGARLCAYPFLGLQDEVDAALEFKCQHIMDLSIAPPFHKVLYAWRIERGDYRGAASILYERLQRLQTANIGSKDPNSRVVTDAYLALINTLSCVDEDQAWILSTKRADAGEGTATGSIKRVRLESGMFCSFVIGTRRLMMK
ncbi:hypothetical protein EX30DRAFT_74495 [Ascodesmis nigricans]|uniref:Nucleoporin Nup120/160-domain-containing protein n=1 Tax=Ascodesmis nigricans TaxID=341454 RepID=A0A4S2MTB2_9PEZI|nr:hypothetical protein EX30DRAFT_74495 [Ascodesmis nigricans]